MSTLCKYKDFFGKPNTGLHRYRIFDIAMVDVAVTIFFGYIISLFVDISLWIILVVLFITGIVAHRLFCVRTRLDKMLFP
jgi:hypothetical protein